MFHSTNIGKLFPPTSRLVLYFKKKAKQMKEAGKIKSKGRRPVKNANSNK